jgi:hypothetical protein
LHRQSPNGLTQYSPPTLHLKPRAHGATPALKNIPRDARREDPAVASLHIDHLFLH